MQKDNWDKKQEEEFKIIIKKFFDNKIDFILNKSKNPLEIGDNLAEILKNSDEDVVKIITPRAVKKWASPQTLPKWEEILGNSPMLLELRIIGRSIANTMRPLAGNNFARWVAKILNIYFLQKNMPLKAITSGPIKRELEQKFKTKVGKGGVRDYKPDVDIILIRIDKGNKPVAIISAKTTLAERVMQTITWSRYLKIKVFLVTAWETFESGTNRERVQELDGVYVCNKDVQEYGNIKLFSKITKDLEKFCH
ncbi:MAG: BsaWI family type II restriction enzyme [Patescibacteria group bacterium]